MKMDPARRLIDIKNLKNIKHLLVKNHKAYSFDIWYVTSSSGLLQTSNYALKD
jgi:hypothetical protein